jgi:penicillin-binding protein 2
MANLYATIGNGGQIWRPYLVKRIMNHVGETVMASEPELIRRVEKIKPETFKIIKEGLEAVVMDKEGTGRSAFVEGQTVAGKTGSVQVVSLTKNNKASDVSMLWREHAMFASFSPVDHPEIAVAIVSEHDKVGGGGKSAAPVAGRIIKAYWDIKKRREGALTISQSEPPKDSDKAAAPQ